MKAWLYFEDNSWSLRICNNHDSEPMWYKAGGQWDMAGSQMTGISDKDAAILAGVNFISRGTAYPLYISRYHPVKEKVRKESVQKETVDAIIRAIKELSNNPRLLLSTVANLVKAAEELDDF